MIRIVNPWDAPIPEGKEVIPSQLYAVWADILKHPDNEGYSLLLERDGMLLEKLDFYILKREFGSFLVSIPYAIFGSCLSRGSLPYLKEFFSELEGFAREQGCLSMSVGTHPLSELSLEDYSQVFDYRFHLRNFVQMSELDQHPLEKLKPKRRAAFRNEISKVAESDLFTLETTPNSGCFAEWLQVYANRYGEIGASTYPDWFFQNMYGASRSSEKIQFRVLRTAEEVVGGIFFVRGRNVVEYFTSAFNTAWNKYYPTTYVLNQYLDEVLSQGVRFFNWQSSPKHGTGVYEYKRRWGAYETEHLYLSKNLVPVDDIKRIPLSHLRRECAGCYILPYSLWEA